VCVHRPGSEDPEIVLFYKTETMNHSFNKKYKIILL
jgi:hypothetical protein